METWAHPSLCGGLPGRATDNTHSGIQQALDDSRRNKGSFSAYKEDIAKAFDSIEPEVAIQILEAYGLPKHLPPPFSQIRKINLATGRTAILLGREHPRAR